MNNKIISIVFVLTIVILNSSFSPVIIPESKGKQKKYFPKIINDAKVYFGMTEEKFLKKNSAAILGEEVDFRKTYTVKYNTGAIEEIIYYFTTEETPLLYEFIIKYKNMERVFPIAKELLGEPNYRGEWRIANTAIKEYFNMAIWTFGHKMVYATTLKHSEWKDGF